MTDIADRIHVMKFSDTIWNAKTHTFRDKPHVEHIYIGRAFPRKGIPKSIFANPYAIDKNAQNEDLERFRVVKAYSDYIRDKSAILGALRAIGRRLSDNPKLTVNLVCWCKKTPNDPTPCHGDILKSLILKMSEDEDDTEEQKALWT